jgi:hypothetical protein
MVTTVKWNLATIGALITIFRLSFAPLAQQVIEFVPQNVARPDGINVAFGYSHAFQRPRASSVIITVGKDPSNPFACKAKCVCVLIFQSLRMYEC